MCSDNVFNAYSIHDRKNVDLIVVKKIVTSVRGHLTYVLVGKTNSDKTVSTLVNKSQWDKYNVPIEEKEVKDKINRKSNVVYGIQGRKKRKSKQPKSKRKCYNEEIEKWLADHYDLNLDELK
jgi:hypothetical protein